MYSFYYKRGSSRSRLDELLDRAESLQAIQENIICVADLKTLSDKIDSEDIGCRLLEPDSLQAIRDGLFSVRELMHFIYSYGVVHELISERGIAALRERLPSGERLISVVDLIGLTDRLNDNTRHIAYLLLQPDSLQAIRNGLFSVPELMHFSYGAVHELISERGIAALRERLPSGERLISVVDLIGLTDRLDDTGHIAWQLLQPDSLQAIRDELFSVLELMHLSYDVVDELISERGIAARRESQYCLK